jgi:hypothetical protein
VSDSDASSLAAFVVPAGQEVHTFEDTYSFAPHNVSSHVVSDSDASSLAAFVVPAGQEVHTFEDTYSFASHNVAASDPTINTPMMTSTPKKWPSKPFFSKIAILLLWEEGRQERPIFFSTNRALILDLKYLCRGDIGSNTPMRPHDRH